MPARNAYYTHAPFTRWYLSLLEFECLRYLQGYEGIQYLPKCFMSVGMETARAKHPYKVFSE